MVLRTLDAVHALLSLVSYQGQEAVETSWQPEYLQSLQVGHCEGVLELLRLVSGACPT